MQAVLANVPRSETDWKWWAWHHRESHAAIRQAIAAKYGVRLQDYQIEPIPADGEYFLEANNHMHSDFNSVLGLQSQDLQSVDLNDESALRAWIWDHFREHRDAEIALGISS